MSNIVSVVVPIYNVAAYLPHCLDSILDQARDCPLDVVLVDDGSTDASASIAETYADKHACVRLIRQANGGLGHARNVGARHAAGDYLTFVDSDDIVPKGAYGAMMRALNDPDIDFSSGNVLRLRGRSTGASIQHRDSHAREFPSTHVREFTTLLWDVGAWNKIFRRRFWEDHDLQFPEGVLYEEQEIMARGHLLAKRVAVLKQVCYLWRVRTEWPPSITQRRYEIRNLKDRFTAILSTFQTLDRYATVPVRHAYEHKVLTNDIPLYVRQYQVTDSDEYRRLLIDYVDQVLDLCASESLDRIKSVDRTRYWLIRQGRVGELSAINACERSHFDTCPLTIREGRAFRAYPTRDDAEATPAGLTDVTSELAPHTCVYDICREGSDLRMDVHAFVPGISPEASGAMTRRFYLLNAESGTRIELAAEPLPAGVPTSMLQILHFDGAWSRVTLRVPVDSFIMQIGEHGIQASMWEAWVDCELEGLTWSDRVRRRDNEYTNRERFIDRGNLRVIAGLSHDDRLQVRVDAAMAHARREAASDGDGFSVALPHGEHTNAATLIVSSIHGPLHELKLQPGPEASWLVSASQLTTAMTQSALNWAVLSVRTPTGEHRVIAPPAFRHEWKAADGYLMSVGADAEGYVTAFRREGGCQISELSLSAQGVLHLRLEGTDPERDLSDVRVELVGGDCGTRLALKRIDDSNCASHRIDLARINRWGMEAPASLGEWHIIAQAQALTGVDYEPQVTAALRSALPVLGRHEGVRVIIRANDAGRVTLRIGADWPDDANLLAKRRRLETAFYPRLHSRQRPTQSVVFQSWGGGEFSDGPRRVYEELARRVPQVEVTWIVRDPSVWLPRGVSRVLRDTKEYFEAIGRARYAVSNTPMPEHFEKAHGCTYVRLGRGIPVKRIGKDVTGLASLTPSNTRAQINDARRWDLLVAGHSHASCIYRRAFEYEGAVHDAGQPRLDRLVDGDAPQRRERIRATLGIGAAERVVLYAPTWRDNLFAGPNRYVMPQGLEIARLVNELGAGWRLLVKNHPYVGDRTRQVLDERVINAHGYPEMTDLYLAADVLVTDYSSATFDFAVTRKPILVFAPDLEEYRERIRGTYWDLEMEFPGPVVRSTDSLIEHLHDLSAVETQWQRRYDDFRTRFCSVEDGRATQRVVEAVFTDWLD